MEDSTEIIGNRLADSFHQIFKNTSCLIGTELRSRSLFLDFSNLPISENSTVKTCTAAFGCSFAAGTIDGNPVDNGSKEFCLKYSVRFKCYLLDIFVVNKLVVRTFFLMEISFKVTQNVKINLLNFLACF